MSDTLFASDPIFAWSGTGYPLTGTIVDASRGIEGVGISGALDPRPVDDIVSLSADRRTLSFTFNAGNSVDQIRILSAVSAVPVPASIWLFGSGLVGLPGVVRKRSIQNNF